MRPLDTLRAFARRDIGEPVEGLTSHNSLFSPAGTLANTESGWEAVQKYKYLIINNKTRSVIDGQAAESKSTDCEISEISAESPPAADEIAERVALVDEGTRSAPKGWAEGFATLCTMSPPEGILSDRWHRIVDSAGDFLDRWAEIAIACGWSAMDVFGAHPTRPEARFDCKGLILLLDRCRIVSIDAQGADLVTVTGARQRFRRRPMPNETVLLWKLDKPG